MIRAALLFLALPAFAGAIDGDTLDWNGNRWRLSSIDTPERGEPFYAQAKARLSERTREGLACHQLPEKPSNGRLIGWCEVSGQDVALVLAREGLAAVCHNRARASIYAVAEREAIAAKRGIWADGSYRRKGYCK